MLVKRLSGAERADAACFLGYERSAERGRNPAAETAAYSDIVYLADRA